jgi:hypothetical protein
VINSTPPTPEQIAAATNALRARIEASKQKCGEAIFKSLATPTGRGQVSFNFDAPQFVIQQQLLMLRLDAFVEIAVAGGFPADLLEERWIAKMDTLTQELGKPQIAQAVSAVLRKQ